MDNLVSETNIRLQEIIDNIGTIKQEYENKLSINAGEIEEQLQKVRDYKSEFLAAKQKVDKMNADIEGFEEDYKNLVERFKDDELANILIAANKEISAKIEERKKKIILDKKAMNELVEKAESLKEKLVKLTAEKKALELCLNKIMDAYTYYGNEIGGIINYSTNNNGHLCSNTSTIEVESSADEAMIEFSDETIIDEEVETVNDNQVEEEKNTKSSKKNKKNKKNEEEKEIEVDIQIDDSIVDNEELYNEN